jgi:sugar transferase (PEP-CTERM system associated)
MTSFRYNLSARTTFIILGAIEALVFFVSAYLAIALRFNTLDVHSEAILTNFGSPLLKATFFSLLHVLGMIALGQYQAEQYRDSSSFTYIVSKIIVSMMLVSLMMIILFYLVPAVDMGVRAALLAVSFSVLAIIALRKLFLMLADTDFFCTRVLIFGTGERAASLYQNQMTTAANTYKIVGFVSSPNQSHTVPEEMIVNVDTSLLTIARQFGVNEIVLAMDDRRREFPTKELLECKMAGLIIADPTTFLEQQEGKVNLQHLNPSWMIYGSGFSNSPFKDIAGRIFDILSSLLILALTLPILVPTAFLIALESGFRDPVFYRQVRVGKDGDHFKLLKFRSMRVNAEQGGAVWASQNDNRVTRIGSFIRKYRIDELPQILNILKGDMRLVGPRPERPEFVEQLSTSIPMYPYRHSVKPGLAGWAQLKYPYGASEEDAYQKLQYDLYYIKNYNLVMDFFILLQTIEVVLFGKGAR